MKQVALGPRAAEILHSIVQSYIETGEPVASSTISRQRKDGLSAASVRNVMADLYEMGYLAQPHTSAGRIPTESAFRSYVQTLAVKRLLSGEIERLRNQLGEAGSMEGRVELSSQILTEMTHAVGIAAAIPTTTQILDSIELLSIPDRRVLMIVVTRDRMVRNQVVALDENVMQDELNSIRNYVNMNFAGWALTDVRRELRRRFEEERATYDTILRRLTVLFEKGLLDLGLAPQVHMDGVSNLIGLDLHLTRERLRELFRALEEKKRLLLLLDQFLESRSGEVAVRVGLGDAHPGMRELSLIGITVVLPGGLSAKVAVLGPMRMDYQKVISAVQHVGEAMQRPPV